MIDIHTHLLPGIDDGVGSIVETRAILDAYRDHGFTHLVCTPHVDHPTVQTRIDLIRERYGEVKREAAKRGITLLLGSEVYVTSSRPKPAIPIAKRFQLIEFNTQTKPLFLTEVIFHFSLLGLEVIIAHIDRYSWFNLDDPLIKRVREMGVYFQVNTDALHTAVGKRFLEAGIVDFIATDHHGGRRGDVPLGIFRDYGKINARSMNILGL